MDVNVSRIKQIAGIIELGFAVYSYSEILQSSNLNPIEAVAEATKTGVEGQLRFELASDARLDGKTSPHAAIAVLPFGSGIDYKKFVKTLVNQGFYERVNKNKFSKGKANPKKADFEPGHVGLMPIVTVPALIKAPPNDNIGDHVQYVPIPYVFDRGVRDLENIGFLVGYGKADNLVVLSAKKPLGDKFDDFLSHYMHSRYLTDDIRR